MRRSSTQVAVLYADLDKFKTVNDTHGHRVGDELLLAVVERVTEHLRPGDVLSRLSGDEFVILCEDVGGRSHAGIIAERIVTALSEPFLLSCGPVATSISIGIAFMGHEEFVPEDLLHHADVAMYQAKGNGGGRHQFVNLAEVSRSQRQIGLLVDLRQARRGGELELAYQPIVRSHDGTVVGVEALLRWPHQSLGLVATATLIPLMEKAGLTAEIGEWVLHQACVDHRHWNASRPSGAVGLSVNVSTSQLLSPDFAAVVEAALDDTDTDPRLLTFDLTESALMQDADRSLVVLADLKKLGISLALDDFSSAIISLRYIKQKLIDKIKLELDFVSGHQGDQARERVASASVSLAHALDLTVVAAKIETPEYQHAARQLGCDASQGNYFARPMPAAELDTLFNLSGNDPDVRLPRPVASGVAAGGGG
jgi:diguanylate cyclase (GGDEF)-like protein